MFTDMIFLQLWRIWGWAELQRSQDATANHSNSTHLIHHHSRTMNFTMNYNIASFSHIFNIQNIWFGKRSESLRASDKPNLISTNERGDNIRPMRRGDYSLLQKSDRTRFKTHKEYFCPIPNLYSDSLMLR